MQYSGPQRRWMPFSAVQPTCLLPICSQPNRKSAHRSGVCATDRLRCQRSNVAGVTKNVGYRGRGSSSLDKRRQHRPIVGFQIRAGDLTP